MESKEKYHFIIGMPRAGTTLLSTELNKHKQILVLPESKHVLKMLKNRNYQNELKKYYQKVKWKIKNTPYVLNDQINIVIKESRLKSIQDNSIAIGKCFSFFNNNKEPTTIIDKNPLYTFHFEKIIKEFPDSKFVIMLRNPNAFVLSKTQKKNSKNKIQSPWYFASVWNNFASEIIKLRNLYPEKVMLIKYEEMIENKEIIPNILNFFGSDQKVQKTESFESEYQNLVYNGHFTKRLETKYKDLSKPIYNSRINAYKEIFGEKKIQRIESICFQNMTALKYLPSQFPYKPNLLNLPFKILGKLHKIRAKRR